jgi:carbon-monoxide dehydrogenase iron sulfur subunit
MGGAVQIDAERCINCGMCAMACPFGVLTYAPAYQVPDKTAVALKCDQCPDREALGRTPACVEACKVGALTYGEVQAAQDEKGRAVAQAFFAGLRAGEESGPQPPATMRLWRQLA